MQLRLKPYHKSLFPFGGVLIKGTSIKNWVLEIQSMDLMIDSITVFPIPNITPNCIWGCFVLLQSGVKRKIGRNTYCQSINNKIFIPENSILTPQLSEDDLEKLFPENQFIFHPEFGLFELSESLNWSDHVSLPESKSVLIQTPKKGVFIPKDIFSFQIGKNSTEEIIQNLEKNIFPQREKMKNEPLSLFEKVKLQTLRLLFREEKDKKSDAKKYKETPLLEYVSKLFSNNKLVDKLITDLDDLERRNQKEVDKLLELFKKNPELALKYAIPLDETGTVRGGNLGRLELSHNWSDFSLFSRSTSGSGTGSISSGHYNSLFSQYHNTATELIKKKEHHKAAFIYMKLLKNYYLAAQTLEKGEYYEEAASVYLKYASNKLKAAECFEKGKMTSQAIEIYKELNRHEKVGDLYTSINHKDEAKKYYYKVIEEYKLQSQFVKASLVYKYKIKDTSEAQALLLDGWKQNKDAYNCLNNYFSNIDDAKQRENEIEIIYAKNVDNNNKETFLQVLKHEHIRSTELKQMTKNIAYEIISEIAQHNPQIISELKSFNRDDNMLLKDILKFKKR